MLDIIREAPIGQAIRFISRNRLLRYPEEESAFQLPAQYTSLLNSDEKSTQEYGNTPQNELNITDHDSESLAPVRTITSIRSAPYSSERMQAERTLALERTKTIPIAPQMTSNGIILVDWCVPSSGTHINRDI